MMRMMELWIAKGNRKELKKEHPFLRDFGVIDIKEITSSLGYESSIGLDDHSSFIVNNEIVKRLEAFNNSRRFYRVLFLVEECREQLAHDILNYSINCNFKYEVVYMKKETEFQVVCKSY
jgi:hypothetical protein